MMIMMTNTELYNKLPYELVEHVIEYINGTIKHKYVDLLNTLNNINEYKKDNYYKINVSIKQLEWNSQKNQLRKRNRQLYENSYFNSINEEMEVFFNGKTIGNKKINFNKLFKKLLKDYKNYIEEIEESLNSDDDE